MVLVSGPHSVLRRHSEALLCAGTEWAWAAPGHRTDDACENVGLAEQMGSEGQMRGAEGV